MFNSIKFSLFCISQDHKLRICLVGFTICTHTTSLTFDLTSDQEKLPRNREKNFHREKREETFRRATKEELSPGWTEAIDVMFPEMWLHSYVCTHARAQGIASLLSERSTLEVRRIKAMTIQLDKHGPILLTFDPAPGLQPWPLTQTQREGWKQGRRNYLDKLTWWYKSIKSGGKTNKYFIWKNIVKTKILY